LLDAARDRVAKEGEAALTLSAVADAAGVAHATIYGFFSGKRDLLEALNSSDESLAAPASQLKDAPGSTADRPYDAKAAPAPAWMDYQPDLAAFMSFLSSPANSDDNQPATTPAEGGPEAPAEAEPIEIAPADPTPADPDPVEAAKVDPIESKAATSDAEPWAQPPMDPEERAPTEETASSEEAAAQSPLAASSREPIEPDVPELGSAEHAPIVSPPPDDKDDAVHAQSDGDVTFLSPFEQDRRRQAEELEEIARRLVLPESALREGTDALIARLETRIRVLERSIASLESRHNAIADYSEQKLKPVSEEVQQLRRKTETVEDRLRREVSELRFSIHQLSAGQERPSTEDSIPYAATPETEIVSADPPAKSPHETPNKSETEVGQSPAQSEDSRLAYLSAVRHSAKEGARQAAERESIEEEVSSARRRRLLAAAGVAFVCLAAVGAMFKLQPGLHGVPAAQSKPVAEPLQAVKAAPDPRAPLDRLTALANRGDARAELIIGLKYLKGDGAPADDAKAAHWIERAARAGNPVAENHLGTLYQIGRGVKADMPLAMHWYEAAALQGNRHAMSNLAVLYADGGGGARNLAEAARWFQRSANLGYVDAQFNLAVLFERGDGVPQSLLDAYKWYSIAAASGDAVAKSRAEAIATQVSPEELQAAQQEAAKFRPLPIDPAINDEPTMASVLAAR
jgi:localization factor PodJL